jgi:plastocyanin
MKKVVTLAIALSVATALGVGAAVAAVRDGVPTVRVIGTENFEPNALIYSTFRFSPAVIEVPSGGTLRFIDQDSSSDEPHTLSIVYPAQLPTDVEEVFNCGVCNKILFEHFGNQPKLRVDRDGDGGLNIPGDSIMILPGVNTSITEQVTAPAGTTLNFLCAIHPWMQGKIKVTSG